MYICIHIPFCVYASLGVRRVKGETRNKSTNTYTHRAVRKQTQKQNKQRSICHGRGERNGRRKDRVAKSSVYNVNCQKARFNQKTSPCSPSTFLALPRAPSGLRHLTRYSAQTLEFLFYLLYAVLTVLFQQCYALVTENGLIAE